MCEANMSVQQLTRWMVAYTLCANSERFDDLISKPSSLVVPLVCLRFSATDESADEREEFDLALPGSATIGEIHEAMDSLPDGGSPEEHMVSYLARRYEESGALAHISQEHVPAQLFHANGSYRTIALTSGRSWNCSMPMKYSISSVRAYKETDEDATLLDTVNAMLGEQIIRSSRFAMPHEAIDCEYRYTYEDD